eukprot:2605327-Lingulodinium_polyedra.AAC.1
MACWCTEQAGLAELFVSHNADAIELLRQMGISAPAAKQKPFIAWVRGTRACRVVIHMPGQRGADKHAAKCA